MGNTNIFSAIRALDRLVWAFILCFCLSFMFSAEAMAISRLGLKATPAVNKPAITGSWTGVGKKSSYNLKLTFKIADSSFCTIVNIAKRGVEKSKSTDFNYVVDRPAGKLSFKGGFSADNANNQFAFETKKSFEKQLTNAGISNLTAPVLLSMALTGLKSEFPLLLKNHKLNIHNLDGAGLLTLFLLKVDGDFLDLLRGAGFENLSAPELIALRSMNANSAFLADKNYGVQNQFRNSVDWLLAKRAEWIANGHLDIADDTSFNVKTGAELISNIFSDAQEPGIQLPIISTSLIDSYVKLFDNKLTKSQLLALIYNQVQPEFIVGLKEIAFPDATAFNIVAANATGVNKQYIMSFDQLGYSHETLADYLWLKAMAITPDFVLSFKGILKNIPFAFISTLKTMAITSDLVKKFQSAGLSDLGVNEIVMLKYENVSPTYVAQLKQEGFDVSNIQKIIRRKKQETSDNK